MLLAIRKFDPNRSASLATFIRYSLQYEVLRMKRRHRPHGVTSIPKGERLDFLSLDKVMPDGNAYELPFDVDMTHFELSEFFESLSESEAEAVDLRLQGYPVRRKAQTAALGRVRQRYVALYA
jgi:hypothetical protein